MPRLRFTGVAFGLIASVGIGWGVLKIAKAASGSATSDLLALQSSRYQIDGKEVSPPPSLLAYLPYLRSRQAAIAEVATLSVLCEVKADQAGLASSDFFQSSMTMVGVTSKESPDTLRWKQRIEARQDEFLNQLRAPMDAAVARGLSDAFSKEDLVTSNESAPKNGKVIGNIIATQSDRYKTELALRRMQAALYDRCESLARSEAGGTRLDGDGARVVVEGRRKNSMIQFWMILRNQTGKDLHHVTLSIVVPPPPAKKPDDPRLVGVLGGMVSAASGEDGAGEVVKNGNRFAKSVSDYEKLRTLPQRVFYHIPLVPAGQEVMTRLGGSPLGESPVTFSLWCDEGTREHTKFDGLDELTVQVEEFKKEFLAKHDAAEARRKSSLGNGRSQPTEGNGVITKTTRTRPGVAPSTPGKKLGTTPEAERAKTGESPQKLDYFQELQGTWKVVEQVENGKDNSVEMRRNNWTITRTGDSFVLKSNLGFFASGTWTVDDTKDPVELTQVVKKGQGTGKTRHLIIKLEGDTLYSCAGDTTPDDFHSPPGKKLVNAKAVRMAVQGDKVQLAEKKAAAKVGGSGKSQVDIKALELRANAGDSQSMYDLGICYYFGKNVDKDEKKGVAWVEKAAKAGHPGGMYSLATCYSNGIYVKKDFNLANEWLNKAANAGSPEAQKTLARASGAGGFQAMSGEEKAKALAGLLLLGAALSSDQPAAGASKSVCSGGGPFSNCACRGFEEVGRDGQEKFYCQICSHSLSSHR